MALRILSALRRDVEHRPRQRDQRFECRESERAFEARANVRSLSLRDHGEQFTERGMRGEAADRPPVCTLSEFVGEVASHLAERHEEALTQLSFERENEQVSAAAEVVDGAVVGHVGAHEVLLRVRVKAHEIVAENGPPALPGACAKLVVPVPRALDGL
jgi:hypothetical protein